MFMACERKEPANIDIDSQALIGFWDDRTGNDTVTYKRADKLPDNNFGFEFKTNGVFVERKNSGWCGTPPITYSDYEGKWTLKNSTIKITTVYWGGLIDYEWKILSVNEKFLKILILKQEPHENEK